MDPFVDFFDPLPIAVLFAAFIAAGLVFTFWLEALVHRRGPSETRERVSNSAAVMIQVLAVFYAVLVAFVIVSERGAITEANDHVARKQRRCRRCTTTSAGSHPTPASTSGPRSSPTTGRC